MEICKLKKDILTFFYKDFKFYFQSKMMYLLVAVYVAMCGAITFYSSDFFANTTPNLYQFFKFQPGVMALIIPAITMRLWADEYKQNTLEVILGQPVSFISIVLGKFLASWGVVGIMLIASMPIWWSVAVFSNIDNHIVIMNYLIVFVMSGSLCALSFLVASLCYNMIGAFLLGCMVCSMLISVSFKWLVNKFVPDNAIFMKVANAFNFSSQYNDMILGQINLSSTLYFVLIMLFGLCLSVIAVD